MPAAATPRSLTGHLFGDSALHLYAILDGAANPDLRQQLWQQQVPHLCLFPGELDPEIALVAPYLVALTAGAGFTDYVLEGWGHDRGIFLLSDVDPRALRRHFRGLIMVHHPDDGRPLYFRFYDPRVLRVYLPSCTRAEADALFGPVARYLVEDEGGKALLRFRREADGVACERIDLSR